jgi:hypothetical protein
MASSGTYSFTMTRDDIIGAALRLTGAFGDQDVIPATDILNCAQALNILCKELATEGLPLWCVQDLAVPTVAGQAAYNLSAASGTTLPLRILDAYIRSSVGNDVSLQITSRYDYDTLGSKSSPGIPNQCYYDPQIGAGSLVMYNVPTDSSRTIHVVIQRQIQDFNLATDNPDFPQEAFRLLKWCLADEVALEYQAPPDVRQEIAAKAMVYRKSFFAFEQEQTSIYFTPAERGRY